MIKMIYRNIRDFEYKIVTDFHIGSWIHVEKPTQEELNYLLENFVLDKDLLTDALDPDEVPRIEVENNVTYIFTRYPYKIDKQVITAPILFATGENFVVSICRDVCPALNKFLESNIQFYTTQKTKLFLQLFAQINKEYNAFLHTISRQIRASLIRIEKITDKDIIRFVNFERELYDFDLALTRTNSILRSLLTSKNINLYEEDKDLTEDIFLSNEQLIETTNENLRSIVNIRGAYSTIMTNSLNRVIKFFTTITVLLAIPTLIASIYGMNVTLPFQESPYAFIGIILSIICVSGSLLYVFIKKDWL